MQQYVLADTLNFSREVNGVYSPFKAINGLTAYQSENDYYLFYRSNFPNCIWSVSYWGDVSATFSARIDQDSPPSDHWYIGDYNNSQLAYIEVFPLRPWLSYHDINLLESEEQHGTIEDTLFIRLNMGEGLTFSGNNNDNLIDQGKAIITHVPEGLTPVMLRINDTLLQLVFTGIAQNHTSADNVYNLGILFTSDAFSDQSANVKYAEFNNIRIQFSNITALNNYSETSKLQFYPNPANDMIQFQIPFDENEIFYYSLYSIQGKLIESGKLVNRYYNTKHLPAGIYQLQITTKNGNYIGRLIKR
jgi:hypothetical protein